MKSLRHFALAAILLAPLALTGQETSPSTLSPALRWRMIGPFRGGRTKAATGVPSQPSVFYFGAVNGGVWKSNDFGRTWNPMFDAQSSSSIGALEVAISDPNVVYVGSGEGLQLADLSTGDGMYKSTDAGKTWTHLGLRDGWQIARIAIDPHDANRLFVAVLGHPYGANAERGIYRSTNGGQSFEKVLYKDENTGGVDVQFSANDPNTVYAVLWENRLAPWENGEFHGPGSGLFKSTDGGNTWKQLTKGLPTTQDGLTRIQIAPAPSDPMRLYANMNVDGGTLGGVYRSDDAGESWTRATGDERIWGRGDDFTPLTVDPKNADIVYSTNVVTWKSIDGGKTWNSLRGAPGGDDYQRIWVNPNDTKIMLLVADQGAVVTVNGGETWSSWYNQPTAQFYHVTADNAWPYRLCGGQQESGSACVKSRSDLGAIDYRDWTPVGTEEYGYVAPDPLDPDIVYGDKVEKFDRRTGQTASVTPNVIRRGPPAAGASAKPGEIPYRVIRTEPIMFSPTNPHKLYYTSNVVWQTTDGGHSWTAISGDLSREKWDVPANVGVYIGSKPATPTRRGVIYALAPSPVDSNTIWAGTDDGLIWVTRNNGKSWSNVTPPALVPWAKVSIIDASHFDANEAYAAVNTIRLNEQKPHIYRTKDGGKTWTEIVNGIADDASTNVVREDTKRRGLLFAGTEAQVWYSLDDGDHWMGLRLNMPAQSIRDLIIKDNDVAVASHGRGFWILDDISALRQMPAAPAMPLLKPGLATRVRYSMYTDSPMPPDEPSAENPPDGAVIDYWLASDATGEVTLDIVNSAGRTVRHYSSNDKFPPPADVGNWPWYWFRPLSPLGTKAGLNRYVWDLHFASPPLKDFSLPISAIPHQTLRDPRGPFALPGTYTAVLTVDGKKYSQTFMLRMDPRVKTPAAGLKQQYDLSVALYESVSAGAEIQAQIADLRSQLTDRRTKATGATATAIDSLNAKLTALASGPAPSLTSVQGGLMTVYNLLQHADIVPTTQAVAAAGEQQKIFTTLKAKWMGVAGADVGAINAQLTSAGLEAVKVMKINLDNMARQPEGGDDDQP